MDRKKGIIRCFCAWSMRIKAFFLELRVVLKKCRLNSEREFSCMEGD
jgi:hypothetical protein